MDFPLSRAISVATGCYGIFAAIKPRHLGDAMQVSGSAAVAYDKMAYTYAVRDIGISALAVTSTSSRVVTAAMLLRIAGDLGDAAILGASATSGKVRTKVLAVTLTWAALNTIALVLDRRSVAT